ncbi:putative metal-dependent hydrolase [Hymenobacter sp. J193]|uniref:YfiT family bacillithiol transferase n=1 Tax=Hymenobacter sp. J193 TaxID=2898429 RepID=UPI002150A207|nr:putative metal-dependent hydrolase [Hymenobacter sp. J193]MCR5889589.1 putative metal-dependent hydrolase [Hymenobacter sp. J193]
MLTIPEADLRYPIGHAEVPQEPLTDGRRIALLAQLAVLPDQVRVAVAGLHPEQLDTPYRPGGWSVRQVLHHLPDSHMNAYVRMRLALTEELPTIKPYEEAAWAELPDVAATPVAVSLALLEALHIRWVTLMRQLTEEQWGRRFYHPGSQKEFSLDQALALYAWHGRHHLAHITSLRQRENW